MNFARVQFYKKLIIVGEAAARLSADFKELHSEIEWDNIIGFRNIAIHEYFAILWQIVWNTALIDVPELAQQIEKILRDEFQD